GLLLLLMRRLGATTIVALAVACLFAIHPGHVATVQWIASQTELMVSAFLLGATLCHARWRGWGGGPAGGVGWVSGRLRGFLAALGCRENAVMLPLVLLAADWAVARRRDSSVPRRAGALLAYVPHAAVIAGYLALRSQMLGGAALPPKPYVIPPGDPA